MYLCVVGARNRRHHLAGRAEGLVRRAVRAVDRERECGAVGRTGTDGRESARCERASRPKGDGIGPFLFTREVGDHGSVTRRPKGRVDLPGREVARDRKPLSANVGVSGIEDIGRGVPRGHHPAARRAHQRIRAQAGAVGAAEVGAGGEAAAAERSLDPSGWRQTREVDPADRQAPPSGDDATARRLRADARAVQDAGADLLVLECVPAALAAEISRDVSIPTIGIGAGVDCDGQVLVIQDLLGISSGKRPRFTKDFLAGTNSVVAAVSEYARAVRAGEFPGAEHSY
jgi:hypothetical protein